MGDGMDGDMEIVISDMKGYCRYFTMCCGGGTWIRRIESQGGNDYEVKRGSLAGKYSDARGVVILEEGNVVAFEYCLS